jgi:hypothetical protein
MREIWRFISGIAGYEISNKGRVRSYWIRGSKHHKSSNVPRILKGGSQGSYRYVSFWNDKPKSKHRYVHHLVLEAFVGQRPKNRECRHLDGDSFNDCVKNLAWGTKSENMQDQIRHGTANHGSLSGKDHPLASHLTKRDALNIVALRKKGVLMRELEKEFRVSSSLIGRIVNGTHWLINDG